MNIDGKFVVAGNLGPGSGRIWNSLEEAQKYRESLLIVYPGSYQIVCRLISVQTEAIS